MDELDSDGLGEVDVDVKVNVSSVCEGHRMKTLVIQLERLETPVTNSGKCVICSEDFEVPEKPVRKKGPWSRTKVTNPPLGSNPCGKDFKFVLEKCLDGSVSEWRRVRRKDGFSSAFCPLHAEIVLEGRRLEEQMEALEKLLRLQKKRIRDAVVESFLLEGNSWSAVSLSPRLRQYKSLRTILRDVSAKYIFEDQEPEVQSNDPCRVLEDTREPAVRLSVLPTASNKDQLQVEIKEEPLSPGTDDFFDSDLPLLDIQEPVEPNTLSVPRDLRNNESMLFPTLIAEDIDSVQDECSVSPLKDAKVPTLEEIVWGGRVSPTSDPDYSVHEDDDNGGDEEDDDDNDYVPLSLNSKKNPMRRSDKLKRLNGVAKSQSKKSTRERVNVKESCKKKRVQLTDPNLPKKPKYTSEKPKRIRKKPSNPKKTLCQYCESHFESRELLLAHIKSTHGDKKYICNICDKQYNARDTLKGHKRRDHDGIRDVECDVCHRKYATLQLMRDHRRFHFYDATPRPCPLGCGTKQYKGMRRLALHMKYAHSEAPPKRPRNPDLHCPECDKVYRNSEGLQYHRAKVHLKTNPKVMCDVCGKELADIRSLKKHKASQHLKQFKFQCHLCPTQCLFKSHLDAHIKSAHGSQEEKFSMKKKRTGRKSKVKESEEEETSDEDFVQSEILSQELLNS